MCKFYAEPLKLVFWTGSEYWYDGLISGVGEAFDYSVDFEFC